MAMVCFSAIIERKGRWARGYRCCSAAAEAQNRYAAQNHHSQGAAAADTSMRTP